MVCNVVVQAWHGCQPECPVTNLVETNVSKNLRKDAKAQRRNELGYDFEDEEVSVQGSTEGWQ